MWIKEVYTCFIRCFLTAELVLTQVDTVGEPTEKTERERIVLLRKRFQRHYKEKNVMSLKAAPIGPIPQETARLAKAVFPREVRL